MADRRPADDLLVSALASGMTDVQAAAAAGVSARTVRRRRGEPEFMRLVRQARAEMVGGAAGKLAASMTAASDTLVTLLGDADPAIRLKAADKILTHAMRAAELVDLEARVNDLEREAGDTTDGGDDGDDGDD